MTRPVPIIAGTLAAILLLCGAYLGAYYAMLDGQTRQLHKIPPLGRWIPVYRLQHAAVDVTLWPAHQLDRRIRPHYWKEDRLRRARH